MAKLLVHGRDRAQILVRARRALDEPEVEGVSTSPQAGILAATIIASLPAAFTALYRAHDVSPDLASALLDMNSAAFVSTWATWALLLGAAGAVMLRTERCGARTLRSRCSLRLDAGVSPARPHTLAQDELRASSGALLEPLPLLHP